MWYYGILVCPWPWLPVGVHAQLYVCAYDWVYLNIFTLWCVHRNGLLQMRLLQDSRPVHSSSSLFIPNASVWKMTGIVIATLMVVQNQKANQSFREATTLHCEAMICTGISELKPAHLLVFSSEHAFSVHFGSAYTGRGSGRFYTLWTLYFRYFPLVFLSYTNTNAHAY